MCFEIRLITAEKVMTNYGMCEADLHHHFLGLCGLQQGQDDATPDSIESEKMSLGDALGFQYDPPCLMAINVEWIPRLISVTVICHLVSILRTVSSE